MLQEVNKQLDITISIRNKASNLFRKIPPYNKKCATEAAHKKTQFASVATQFTSFEDMTSKGYVFYQRKPRTKNIKLCRIFILSHLNKICNTFLK